MSAEIIHHSLDKFWWANFSSHERYLDPWFPVSLHVAKNNEHKNLWVYVSTGAFSVFFFLSFATGCVVTGENVKCFCKPGYTGTRCERWVPPSPVPAFSPPPHLTGGVGSAGRLLQAPWVWVGLRDGVGPLVSLRLGKGLLGKTQDCHFINH